MSIPTRRAILRTVGLISIAALTQTSCQANNASPPPNDDLAQLLERRCQLIAERDVLDRKWLEVWKRLPSWCTPGRKCLDADGNASGPRVGWPEAAREELIELKDGRLLARPSPADLRALFDADRSVISRDQADTNYRKRSQQLLLRLRAKRTCLRLHGLPMSRDWMPLDTQIDAIELTIAALGGPQFTGA